MRQRFFITAGLILLAVLLVGLNAASYVQKEKNPDDETAPNRSSYNTGATGTRAFYDLLAETGRNPVRWELPPSELSKNSSFKPQTFVIVGAVRRDINETDVEKILQWVAAGGKLVLIDREPHSQLLSTTTDWSVKSVPSDDLPAGVDPSNTKQMIDKVAAVKPVQPTVYTRSVNAVQTSRFAARVILEYAGSDNGNFSYSPPKTVEEPDLPEETEAPPPASSDGIEPPPIAVPSPTATVEKFKIGTLNENSNENADEKESEPVFDAPVVHLAGAGKNLLIDMPYGDGEIVVLTDPFIVSNAGINLVDNAQAAINIVNSRGGMIAFDEYHQGYGANENRLLSYFSGTPAPAVLAQLILIVGVVMFTQSRRFARALPAVEPNRLSKLEYVSAMAEWQRRAKAYDLALENIYGEFRRRASRFVGADNFQTPRAELARMVADKAGLDDAALEDLMFRCEEIIHGEPIGRREFLELARKLRETEEKIGLKRRRAMRRGL